MIEEGGGRVISEGIKVKRKKILCDRQGGGGVGRSVSGCSSRGARRVLRCEEVRKPRGCGE